MGPGACAGRRVWGAPRQWGKGWQVGAPLRRVASAGQVLLLVLLLLLLPLLLLQLPSLSLVLVQSRLWAACAWQGRQAARGMN